MMSDRKKNLIWSELKVGWIVSIALMILFLTVFFLGDIMEFFQPKAEIRVRVPDVAGLRKGAPVWVMGVEVGYVKDIRLHPEGTTVVLSITKRDLVLVNNDAEAVIRTLGLLGDKYVEVRTGSREAGTISPSSEIPGTPEVGVQEIMEIATQSIEGVGRFITQLQSLVRTIERGDGTLAQLIEDPQLYENVNRTVERFSAMLEEVREGEGSLGRLFQDPLLHNRLLAAVTSIQEFAERLNEGEGTLGKIIDDPNLYNSLNRTSGRLSALLESIRKGEGLAGELVRSEELANDIQVLVVSLRELIEDIRENPGKYFSFSVF
jgi:phospholipid/cholesterol/gamma-HCH transport system substrate-binding protein